jgi:hypothetical protein
LIVSFNFQNHTSGVATMDSSKNAITSVDADRNRWVWGFTPQAEIWNGRVAMLGITSILVTQYLSRQGVLNLYDLLHTTSVVTSMVP